MGSNILRSDVRKRSQKPDELYNIIDQLVPGARKIELFARNHNIRKGWLSLGNQVAQPIDESPDKNTASLKSQKQQFSEFIDLTSEVIHEGISCDKCLTCPMIGIRY